MAYPARAPARWHAIRYQIANLCRTAGCPSQPARHLAVTAAPAPACARIFSPPDRPAQGGSPVSAAGRSWTVSPPRQRRGKPDRSFVGSIQIGAFAAENAELNHVDIDAIDKQMPPPAALLG